MASRNWRDAFTKLLPGWMLGDAGERYTGIIGLYADILSQGAAESLMAPWLHESTSPDDALPLIGSGRNMPQYPSETAAQYRTRLEAAWTSWIQAGNEAAMLAQLAAIGCSNIEFKKPTAALGTWDWDSALPSWQQGGGGVAYWSRFYLVIKTHPWTTSGTIGDGSLIGDGSMIGLSATAAEIATLKAIVDKWKPAHVTCPWIIVVTNLAGWATSGVPNGTWYDWRNRSLDARYIDGPGVKSVILTPQ